MNDIFRQSRFPIRRREASKHIIFFGEVKKLRESAPPLRGHFRLWLMGIADVAWLLVNKALPFPLLSVCQKICLSRKNHKKANSTCTLFTSYESFEWFGGLYNCKVSGFDFRHKGGGLWKLFCVVFLFQKNHYSDVTFQSTLKMPFGPSSFVFHLWIASSHSGSQLLHLNAIKKQERLRLWSFKTLLSMMNAIRKCFDHVTRKSLSRHGEMNRFLMTKTTREMGVVLPLLGLVTPTPVTGSGRETQFRL